MSFSFSSLIRLIVLLAVGTTMLAVGLSKLDPPKPERRTRLQSNYTNVNEYFLDVVDRVPRWLDADTGRIAAYGPVDGDVLEAASCSPWVDEKGRAQMIGRWSSRTQAGPMSTSNDFGLARYSFPSGELLDHVSTEIVPMSPPCWYPGTRARILFTAGDGKLYHYAFEPEAGSKELDREAKRDLHPRPVAWRCPMPGSGDVFINDLDWPEDPRMAGCVVVSLREKALTSAGVLHFTRSRIWWLKLNIAGTEVVEAGRLLEDEDDPLDQKPDLRSPTVGALADGRLVLSYLSQIPGETGWAARVTPIELEGDHHVPKARESRSLLLPNKCHPAHANFSSDGRWLNLITGPGSGVGPVTRISTARFFKS